MKNRGAFQGIIWCIAIILLFMFTLSTTATGIGAKNVSTVTTDDYHIMLLIDKSGSMNATDKDGLAKSAARQFVDQLCTTYSDLAVETQVGVMAFSRSVEMISDPGLIQLDTDANTDLLKSQINGIQYDAPNTGGTDLGTAIYEAVLELQKRVSEDCKNMVVMFTDGYSENPKDKQESDNNLDKAFAIARDLDCEIYVVGLNYGGNIKSEGKKEIYNLADTAQRQEGVMPVATDDENAQFNEVNYMITDNISDVREFYGRVYAMMIGSELEFIDNHRFFVTSESVVEADVTIYSETEITNIQVVDPEGKERHEDGKTFFVSGDEYYKVIRIMEPQRGEWLVSASTWDVGYKSFAVQFYGIEMAIQAMWGEQGEFPALEFNNSYIGQVVVTPIYKGEIYRGQGLQEDIRTAQFTASIKDNEESYTLSYDEEAGKFIGYFPVETGKYHLRAELSGNSIHRVVECDLEVNVPDIPEQELNINPAQKDIKRLAMDEGTGFKWYYALTMFTAMLIIGTNLVIILLTWRNAYIKGRFEIKAVDLKRHNNSDISIEKYPHGKSFTVWSLFEQLATYMRVQKRLSEKDKELLNLLEKEKREIAKKRIKIRKIRGNRKIYELYQGDTLCGITKEITCYESKQLKLSIRFYPEQQDSEEEKLRRGFRHTKKRGRTSGRVETRE